MALENVMIILQISQYGSKSGKNLCLAKAAFIQIIHCYVILLSLYIQQIVERYMKIIPSYTVVMDGHLNAFLFFHSFDKQCIQLLSQIALI